MTGLLQRRCFLPAAAFAVALALYANSLPGDFVWDDVYLVRDNASLASLADVPTLFTAPGASASPIRRCGPRTTASTGPWRWPRTP